MKSKNWPHICQMDINMNLNKCQKSSVAAGCVKKSLFSTNCWDNLSVFSAFINAPKEPRKNLVLCFI